MKISFYSTGLFILTMLVFAACGTKETGQLIGVQDRPNWKGINPYGMVYIPSGTLTIGQTGEDIFRTHNSRPRAISISGFFMDDAEISNNEYREFVYYVRDSVAHALLDHYIEDEFGNQRLDWEYEIDWNDPALEDFYLSSEESFNGRRTLNTGMMNYEYNWLNWQKAAHNPGLPRSEYLKSKSVNIYPDTMVWIRDFGYSYNEPMTRNYFSHPAFDDYPVVGIDWVQANAFCHWRTELWNNNRPDEPTGEDFRLPTEYEWEYAARGGHEFAPYPWGAYYLRNKKGCLLANFKPGRGNYPEDGGLYTVHVYAYNENDYGLFNMAGNVSEWTSTYWSDFANEYVHDLNPDVRYDATEDDPDSEKRKVIRGGSWKSIAYYLQTSTRHWEYQDTAKSYIGFRCALTNLGRSIDDFR